MSDERQHHVRVLDAGRLALRELAQETAAALRGGSLAVLPTDTVYGLAAHPARPRAVARLYEAKGRAAGKPIALLACDIEAVKRFGAAMDSVEQRLAERFWPGPLTLVLRVSGGVEGFRVPDCEVTRAVLKAAGGVLRVTSVNRSGAEPASTIEEALSELGGFVDILVDGGLLKGGGTASTVAKVEDGRARVLRPGPISERQLLAAADSGLSARSASG